MMHILLPYADKLGKPTNLGAIYFDKLNPNLETNTLYQVSTRFGGNPQHHEWVSAPNGLIAMDVYSRECGPS